MFSSWAYVCLTLAPLGGSQYSDLGKIVIYLRRGMPVGISCITLEILLRITSHACAAREECSPLGVNPHLLWRLLPFDGSPLTALTRRKEREIKLRAGRLRLQS